MSAGALARRRVAAVAVSIVAVVASPVASATAAPSIAPRQALLVVRTQHVVRSIPTATTDLAVVRSTRPITGIRTVLPLVGTRRDARGRTWHRVRLPGRANGERTPPRLGWLLAQGTRSTSTNLHLVVNLRTRRVLVYRQGRVIRRFRVIVGAPSTPTPVGTHFVEEAVRMPAGAAGGPYGLATSARSRVLYEFAGGPGQIALHGRANVGGTLGTAVSHGCVRLANTSITWLAERVETGTPVTIVRGT